MKRSLPILLSLLPALILCVLIFLFSSQTAAESSGTSSRLITWLLTLKDPHFAELPQKQQRAQIQQLQFITRKGAHFSIYTLLGICLFLPLNRYTGKLGHAALAAWLFCVAYAVTDELHQYFIPGRSCELRDLLIDSSGALLGVLISCAAAALWKRRQKKKNAR